MIYFRLFFEFFKIGLFAVGGGLATLPFLSELAAETGWFDAAQLTDMIAVSESTPGPIGINMSTYTGFSVLGIPGGVISTAGLVLPSVIVCVLVQMCLDKFKESKIVDNAFNGLRPASMALITAAGISVITGCLVFPDKIAQGVWSEAFNINGIIFAAILFWLFKKYKKHPVVYIALSAVVGVIIGF